MKGLYIRMMRFLRKIAKLFGLIRFLENRSDKRYFLYLRSLFSIYDIEDMIRLDLPWWTFSATAQIEKFLADAEGNAEVFEYGPGASTVWLAKRSRQVTYVEHDEEFGQKMSTIAEKFSNISGSVKRPTCQNNDSLSHSQRKGYENCDFSEYVRAIRNSGGPFDLIVIDGRARILCFQEALSHLKEGGVILFDNSGRNRYQKGMNEIACNITRYSGLAPALPYFEETSIIVPNKN